MSDDMIDITPEGAKTPEGVQRIHEGMQGMDDAIRHAASVFQELVHELEANGNSMVDSLERCGLSHEYAADTADRIEDAMDEWRKAGRVFLQAVAGAPK